MKKLLASLLAVSMILVGCSSSSTEEKKEETPTTETGAVTKEGVGQGIHGDVKVAVTVEDGKITKVEVTSHEETEGIGTLAVDEIPGKIVEANSVNVDAVTNATITSDAIIEAVEDALTQMGLDPADYK